MSELNYRLAVLTHGRSADLVSRALASFDAHVTPAASAGTLVYHDGPIGDETTASNNGHIISTMKQQGFCAATADLWRYASEPGADYVFWLEHDFEFVRDVDLRDLATVLDADHTISQLSLMRDAVNERERAAGGLFESRNGAENWERHSWGYIQSDYVWTTNPALIRRAFMVDNPWPDYPDQCEGRFGIDLSQRGYRGGVYGDGSVYCRHVGVRDGFGY